VMRTTFLWRRRSGKRQGNRKDKVPPDAKEAGLSQEKARVKEITLFHFSPRYSDLEEEIRKEAMEAFGKE